jgi:hypothetical protein
MSAPLPLLFYSFPSNCLLGVPDYSPWTATGHRFRGCNSKAGRPGSDRPHSLSRIPVCGKQSIAFQRARVTTARKCGSRHGRRGTTPSPTLHTQHPTLLPLCHFFSHKIHHAPPPNDIRRLSAQRRKELCSICPLYAFDIRTVASIVFPRNVCGRFFPHRLCWN